jgi:nucleoid DNA-binding protein
MAVTQAQFTNQLQTNLSDKVVEASKGEINEILDVVGDTIAECLRKDGRVTVRGVGIFSTKKKPATRARKGINPFTKEEQMFKAKPASTQVKVRAAKVLRDAVERKK